MCLNSRVAVVNMSMKAAISVQIAIEILLHCEDRDLPCIKV